MSSNSILFLADEFINLPDTLNEDMITKMVNAVNGSGFFVEWSRPHHYKLKEKLKNVSCQVIERIKKYSHPIIVVVDLDNPQSKEERNDIFAAGGCTMFAPMMLNPDCPLIKTYHGAVKTYFNEKLAKLKIKVSAGAEDLSNEKL